MRQEQYWRPEVDARVAALPLDRAADHALDALLSTCTERLDDAQDCLERTGGFDSLALVAERAGVAVCTSTRSASRPADRDSPTATRIGWRRP